MRRLIVSLSLLRSPLGTPRDAAAFLAALFGEHCPGGSGVREAIGNEHYR